MTHGSILGWAFLKENSEQRGAVVIASIGKRKKMILICDGLNNLSR
ncbi:hypothetical protein SQ56_22455 [Klebsiella variicola]|nr:hypothetical protein JG24_06575 [Klebsiella variicola]MDT7006961.1 hypothetical protein [Klebsiella variicola]MDT7027052.1 hypothetical protein [Klebsiella variicola]OVE56233.1 hypothetical protein SQ56_22455 [Klebsiella variicola]